MIFFAKQRLLSVSATLWCYWKSRRDSAPYPLSTIGILRLTNDYSHFGRYCEKAAPVYITPFRPFSSLSINRQVDFQNIGFTAELSTPTEPIRTRYIGFSWTRPACLQLGSGRRARSISKNSAGLKQ